MPLTPTDTLPPNPDVRIFFSGLMIIDADNAGETCEVFVNRAALNHHFSVVVREKRIDRPDVVLMRLPCEFSFLPDLTGNQTVGLEILANPHKGLAMYTGAPQPDGSETFRLAIDLESTMFHGKSIEVDEGGRPSILLNSGIFYAAERTMPQMVINLKRGGSVQQLGSFANLIGANISLGDKETLTIRWLDVGVVRALQLKRKEGSTYEIYINNDPLFVDPEAGEAHDEFKEYYKILDSIPPEERFELKVDPKSSPKGTPRTLCMTVVKGGVS
jgi:hypothetical protein